MNVRGTLNDVCETHTNQTTADTYVSRYVSEQTVSGVFPEAKWFHIRWAYLLLEIVELSNSNQWTMRREVVKAHILVFRDEINR